MSNKDLDKKWWKVRSQGGKEFAFKPVFESNLYESQPEARIILMKDPKGNEYRFNYLDLQMFLYFIGNEEQRRKLANMTMKQVRQIPYEVTVKFTPEEKKLGMATRRIELPVDEVIAAYAKNEGLKYFSKTDPNFMKDLIKGRNK